ncbi:MAG: patatin-like phospholipase family protein [Oscillospiraceae bacterium]|nr:patatin-like phospholipase family protein [Oscillospiraceae bacterium]
MKDKIGLVLAGGGGKGAYQIGVWQALDDLGLSGSVGGVSGTSVGALNGALFCSGNLDMAQRAWSGLDESAILTRNTHGSYNGWLSNSGLREMVRRYVDIDAVKGGKCLFYAAASRVTKPAILFQAIQRYSEKNIAHKAVSAFFIKLFPLITTVRYFDVKEYDNHTVEDIIIASAAIPLVFPDVVIDDGIYIDGGVKDNTPITPLYKDGLRKMIVISLDKSYRVPEIKFPGAKFFVFRFNEGSRMRSLAGTFDFAASDAKERMKLGYDECIAASGKLLEFIQSK